MDNFNLSEYIKNGSLTENLKKSSKKKSLREGIDKTSLKSELLKVGTSKEVAQYLESLKRDKSDYSDYTSVDDYVEDFLNYVDEKSLQEYGDEDYEQASREIEHGIKPELGDEYDELLDDDFSTGFMDDDEYFDEEDDLFEAKDEEEQEEDDLEGGLDDLEDEELESFKSESESDENIPFHLEQALEQAKELGDEKLITQIGNTITFYTRNNILNEGKVGKGEFDENDPKKLKEFSQELTHLFDKYHPYIYKIDEIWSSLDSINKILRNTMLNENRRFSKKNLKRK